MQQTNSIQANKPTEAASSEQPTALPEICSRRRRRDSGAMLLAVLFMMAIMVIVAMAMAPSFVMQMKRDREEEMIHRGTEYARAVKKFYKKFGRYPASLEQLENTNQIRFLRKRYKDPLTKEGDWKLLHYGDIALIIGANVPGTLTSRQNALGGQPGGAVGATLGGQGSTGGIGDNQGAGTAPAGAQLPPSDQTPGSVPTSGASPFGIGGAGGSGQSGTTLSTGTPGGGQNAAGGQNAGAPGLSGTNNSIFGNSGVGGQTFGGGALVGVASKDKDQTIRVFNKKKTYDEWVFIYSPIMDRVNVLLRGPYDGQSFTGTQIGTPAGQLNQANPNSLGQQPGSLTQQPGGFGQQNPQLTPGNQYPPDQSQPH
jgi:type II secretory pathway pseudopilin PulG